MNNQTITLIMLTLTVSSGAAANIAAFSMAIAKFILHYSWGAVAIVAVVTFAFSVAFIGTVLTGIIAGLLSIYGGNFQPRDDGGKFVPVYNMGKLWGHLPSKPRQNGQKHPPH